MICVLSLNHYGVLTDKVVFLAVAAFVFGLSAMTAFIRCRLRDNELSYCIVTIFINIALVFTGTLPTVVGWLRSLPVFAPVLL